jgi:hypothetical protein
LFSSREHDGSKGPCSKTGGQTLEIHRGVGHEDNKSKRRRRRPFGCVPRSAWVARAG